MLKIKNSKDKILEKFEKIFPTLNIYQKRAIKILDGPLLIIAGPGTGKTLVLILRTLYLIIEGKAKPSEILLTTFTQKAAFELRERISQVSKKLNLNISVHDIQIGTIHSFCNNIILKFLIYTPLKSNYIILDELTQYFFIYEFFNHIIGDPINGKYLGRWRSKWRTIKNIISFFNKISEELIDPNKLIKSNNKMLRKIGESYKKYIKIMFNNNKIDFANLQRIVLDLLEKPEIGERIKSSIKYIMIDEYQDTNYIQERILFKLAELHNNICVVGDEDQSIYRFRGATVRNILEFPKHFKNVQIVKLVINYRSHPNIIRAYSKFIKSIDWSSRNRKLYRFPNKIIIPVKDEKDQDYPSIFCIWGINKKDEAERLAQMILFFKKNKIIDDYSDIAILLTSVRFKYSQHYIDALKKYNIPYFCPRAKSYFENDEIKTTLAILALIFGFYDKYLENYKYRKIIEEGLFLIKRYYNSQLINFIKLKYDEISSLKKGETLNLNIIDVFYQIISFKPFNKYLEDENKARNLALFSRILSIFQLYYKFSVITYKNKDLIKNLLFNSFLKFLIDGGMDEYEDPDNPIPKGYVQIMTIHQSKGLEFPIVIIDSLNRIFRTQKFVDKFLQDYYPRKGYEPLNKITEFDRTRHFYVAFSRAQKILVLSTFLKPKPYFSSIWEGLDQWPYVKKETLKALKFKSKAQFIPKKSYSLTNHIKIYNLCPKQYLFYREYDFQPSRTGQILFGLLVHQTIDNIHKYILNEKGHLLSEKFIKDLLNMNYNALLQLGLRPLAPLTKKIALEQVINYFNQNQDFFNNIIDSELKISFERKNYIILGVIDLLIKSNGKYQIIDFKTEKKSQQNDKKLENYKKQLLLYGYIFKEKYKEHPEKVVIYWTSEKNKNEAITEFKYNDKDVNNIIFEFDKIINKISNKDFSMEKLPNKEICLECDFKFYCKRKFLSK
ncbi:MAG: ATP-dependent DNA helicase [Candidatus Helarchaeota archaeon]